MQSVRGLLLAAAALYGAAAPAQELPPMPGRYMPLYPGLYASAAFGQDERDWSYDAAGHSRHSATPQTPGGTTSFPSTSGVLSLTWHFPMFESYGLGFFSNRTHLARMTFRYTNTRTEGPLAAFVGDTSDDAQTEADDLENNGHGVGDLTLELGSFLAGSADWRTRTQHPFALLLLGGVTVPTGVYEREGPVSSGTNTWSFHGQLGLHWEPWDGGLVDAGATYRAFADTDEAMFGGLAPWDSGDEHVFDLGLTQRVARDFYLGGAFIFRDGDANTYRNPRYAPNAPPPPDMSTDMFPNPGRYRDAGTKLESRNLSLYYFVTQRWMAGLHYTHAQDGRSGQFLLPFSSKTPSGCTVGSSNCQVSAGPTILVDGLGPARSYATDRLTLTITHNFGLGDTFTCAGCKR